MEYSDKLGPHFYYGEFVKSPTAIRLGIDNTPDDISLQNMKALCEKVMEPIRANFKKAVLVHSGFRCEALNKAIGGSVGSQHMNGEAVDWEIPGIDLKEIFEWIVLKSNLVWDQIIFEFADWIHISFKRIEKNRKKITVATKENGETIYRDYTKLQVQNKKVKYI